MSWQKILGQGFTTVRDLLNFLQLPAECGSDLAEKQFPSRIPLGFAQRMQKGNPKDPLLMQVLAVDQELEQKEGYSSDPLTELHLIPKKGLIHKYYGRVLLTVTGVCAVNCRYCFRREFPYKNNNPGRQGWQEICNYIASDSTITEVIFSGGDPLLASDVLLGDLIKQLELIPHVHTVRIHTRIPVVFPERIDEGLCALLAKTRLKKVIILHCNHPQELDESVRQACNKLQQSGCMLLNQSVLLAGINDDAEILARLSQSLFAYNILPYYLHVLDKVNGAAHFDMPFPAVQAVYQKLQTLVPGYLLPRLVKEEPGQQHKTLINVNPEQTTLSVCNTV